MLSHKVGEGTWRPSSNVHYCDGSKTGLYLVTLSAVSSVTSRTALVWPVLVDSTTMCLVFMKHGVRSVDI